MAGSLAAEVHIFTIGLTLTSFGPNGTVSILVNAARTGSCEQSHSLLDCNLRLFPSNEFVVVLKARRKYLLHSSCTPGGNRSSCIHCSYCTHQT